VLQNIMNANDQIAARNEDLLNKNHVLSINIMSSPGAGKTTLLLETIRRLKEKTRITVIEADSASPPTRAAPDPFKNCRRVTSIPSSPLLKISLTY
jgi:Ni2+-binding GTPase involved in maturation of urease and hydrogenase